MSNHFFFISHVNMRLIFSSFYIFIVVKNTLKNQREILRKTEDILGRTGNFTGNARDILPKGRFLFIIK